MSQLSNARNTVKPLTLRLHFLNSIAFGNVLPVYIQNGVLDLVFSIRSKMGLGNAIV